jgi:hypothetical protein
MTNDAEVNGLCARSPAERAEAVYTSQTSFETGERSRRPTGATRPGPTLNLANVGLAQTMDAGAKAISLSIV